MSSNGSAGVAPESGGSLTAESIKLRQLQENIRTNQNLPMAIVGGAAAAIVGALAWGGITFATGYQIGWMAVGVGFLVGLAVRQFGKGIDTIYGISGAALSLVGCVMGNLFASCIAIAGQEEVAISQVMGALNFSIIGQILAATFHPMDILFYGIAIYEGYRFSFRRLTKEELASITSQAMQSTNQH